MRDIRGTVNVRRVGEEASEHAQRRDSECVGGRLLRLEVGGGSPGGRAKRSFMDGVREDKVSQEKVGWRQTTGWGQP